MIGNHVCRQLYRGFESHSLRHIILPVIPKFETTAIIKRLNILPVGAT